MSKNSQGSSASRIPRLADLERQYIETALRLGGGNLSKAARLLGVNRTTLYSRLARLSLNPPADD